MACGSSRDEGVAMTPMEVDPYEFLVRWYLRFNGYLGVENFVVHQTVESRNKQVGEYDILAVRFQNSQENPGFVIQTDPRLLDKADRAPVDFVVAEVKGGRRGSLNKVWQLPANPAKIERVAYVIRWLGPFSDEVLVKKVATELQSSHRSLQGEFLFRVVRFARNVNPKLSLTQITFKDIADFLVRVRAPSWRDQGYGSRSPHNQWPPFIKELWKIADPQACSNPQVKIKAILNYLATAAKQRAGADRPKA